MNLCSLQLDFFSQWIWKISKCIKLLVKNKKMIVGVTYLDVSISKVIVKSGVFTFFGDLNKSGASLVAQC